MEKESKDLIVLENLNAVEVFTGPQGVEKILAQIEGEVNAYISDLTTAKGRKDIASFSAKVSRSKVLLDTLGKDLVADWKAKSKTVDSARKIVRDRLDVLRDKARAPLTQWEKEETERVAAEQLKNEIEKSEIEAYAEYDLVLRAREIERKEAEFARIEEERKAKEDAERKAAEDAEKKRLADEAEAQRIKDTEARLKREADEAAQKRIADAEKAKQDALDAAIKAEADKVEAARVAKEEANRAAQDLKDAAIKAEADKLEAVRVAKLEADRAAEQKEKDRLKKEAAEKAESDRKAADVEHRKKVNGEALESLIAAGFSGDTSKTVIIAIAKGLIKNITINY